MENRKLKEALLMAIKQATTTLPADVVDALKQAKAVETSELAKLQLEMILHNIEMARAGSVPMCQDTGILTFFIKAGVDNPYLRCLRALITEVVAEATRVVPLRPNTVHPFTLKNPGNNLGRFLPHIDWELVDGDEIVVSLLAKGAGSENCCALKMLPPVVGVKGVKKFVVDHVVGCAGRPCPPGVIGVGIGGGADLALKLGKLAILRDVGSRHPDPAIAGLELELLELINQSGIGPMGVGGVTTCLDVHIEYAHRHPSSLPVGIIYQCWADRRKKVKIDAKGKVEVR